MDREQIIGVIEHTLLKPDASEIDAQRIVEEAAFHRFPVVILPPCHVRTANAHAKHLREIKFNHVPEIGTVIGFPLGYSTQATKRAEIDDALKNGATHLDMVMNGCWFQEGQRQRVKDELNDIRCACGSGITLKLIIETCNLKNEAQKIVACDLAIEAGFDYVKTSTGFGSKGATVEDVQLLKKHVPAWVGIKASGGIKDLKTLVMMVRAGADRIGTSSGIAIIGEFGK